MEALFFTFSLTDAVFIYMETITLDESVTLVSMSSYKSAEPSLTLIRLSFERTHTLANSNCWDVFQNRMSSTKVLHFVQVLAEKQWPTLSVSEIMLQRSCSETREREKSFLFVWR
jgi:hypothetical protein